MCQREGCHADGETTSDDDDSGELNLLAELLSVTYSGNDDDPSMRVLGLDIGLRLLHQQASRYDVGETSESYRSVRWREFSRTPWD
mmetsp:Transcript_37160/g.89641  ORF Transcript_37160/g.89641 Transcript_37160/m.89641 type:complete len:86 (+) Transcript_37160:38-295(+)